MAASRPMGPMRMPRPNFARALDNLIPAVAAQTSEPLFPGRFATRIPTAMCELVHAFKDEPPVRPALLRIAINPYTGKLSREEIAVELKCSTNDLRVVTAQDGMFREVTIAWNASNASSDLNLAAHNEFPCVGRKHRIIGDVIVVPYGCME